MLHLRRVFILSRRQTNYSSWKRLPRAPVKFLFVTPRSFLLALENAGGRVRRRFSLRPLRLPAVAGFSGASVFHFKFQIFNLQLPSPLSHIATLSVSSKFCSVPFVFLFCLYPPEPYSNLRISFGKMEVSE